MLPAGQPLGEAASLLWKPPCGQPQDSWQLTRPWAATREPPLSFEAPVDPCNLHLLHLLTDLDGHGTVDMLSSPESINTFLGTINHGLTLWRLDASGVLARDSLLDWKVLPAATTASDLNGDGVRDVAVIAGNLTVSPALMVWLGQRNGAPVLEGYYPLPGEGSHVLTGDVNGDGDTDLIVLGKSEASGHGGVFVLINQGTPATAIASEAATPTALCFRGQLSQSVQSRHNHPLGRARRSQGRGLNHLQCLGAAAAPSVEWSAACWRASVDVGWPRCAGATRRRWGLYVSAAGGRADAHSQDG